MTAEEPKVSPTGRYNVTQASAALGLHRNTLRNYTDRGYIKCGYRRHTYRPFYLGSELLKFWRAHV